MANFNDVTFQDGVDDIESHPTNNRPKNRTTLIED
jgi:hypothetical protein